MIGLDAEAPTGIPRVQDFLMRAAAAERGVGLVHFDRGFGKFVYLADGERDRYMNGPRIFALAGPETGDESGRSGSFSVSSLFNALKIVWDFPDSGRELDRNVAASLTDQQKKGLDYTLWKTTFRVLRWGIAALRFRWFRKLRRGRRAIDPARTHVLLSHMTVSGSRGITALTSTRSRSMILHDLIPVTHPELTINPRHGPQAARELTEVLREQPLIHCTSRASEQALKEFVRANKIPMPSIARFTLPSFLHEKAAAAGRTGRIDPAEPFVFYCSTIEARKNHLLLLRIWARSIAEGRPLPRLVLAGKWGWGVEAVHHFWEAHPELRPYVTFTGQIGDDTLIDFYRSARFGVMPSIIEGWGYGASECLDFATPVIVSTAPALIEATHGLMPAIDPGDFDGWYETVSRLARDDEMLKKLRAKIAEGYSPTASAESWEKIRGSIERYVQSSASGRSGIRKRAGRGARQSA
ncbi:MAG: glycosyltransferase [Flavobacteriaceae bacterium]